MITNEQALIASKMDFLTGKNQTEIVKEYAKNLLEARKEAEQYKTKTVELEDYLMRSMRVIYLATTVMQKAILPQGMTAESAMTELYGILDNEEIIDLEKSVAKLVERKKIV